MNLLKTYMEAASEEKTKPKKDLSAIAKKIADKLITEYEKILDNTSEYQSLDTDSGNQEKVENEVMSILKRHGW